MFDELSAWEELQAPTEPIKTLNLYPYQDKLITGCRNALASGKKRLVAYLPTGGGKCLGRDTPVIMADGSTKAVQDVIVGDRLMGPDGKSRTVLSLARGQDQMFKITPSKGESYIANSVHLLSLKLTGGSDSIILASGKRISANERGPIFVEALDLYLSNKTARHCLKAWRPDAVDFECESTDHPIPPYILGIWLGDGTAAQPMICKPEGAVTEAFRQYATASGCDVTMGAYPGKCPVWRITNRGRINPNGSKSRSVFHAGLDKLGVIGNKHIPENYIMTTREARLELLAGLIDTDGYLGHGGGYDLLQKSEQIAKSVVFIARSLGLAAYASRQLKKITSTGFEGWYWRVFISGDCSIIPCRDYKKKSIPKKRQKDQLLTGIHIEPIGQGDYFGFEIDGDQQFLLGDWQVTHNTMVAMGIVKMAKEKGKRVAFVCNRVQLIQQTSENFTAYGIKHGIIQGANTRDHDADVVVASIQTLAKRGMDDYDLLILDECHACAGTKAYAEIMRGKVTVGLTATPYQKGLGRVVPSLGGPLFESIVAGVTMRELIDTGYLVDADVWAPADPDLRGVKTVAGDYQEDQLGEAMDKAQLVGDIVSHWLKLAPGTQTMVFAVNIAHSRHICDQFKANGIAAVHVDYHMTDEEKQAIYADFKAGRSMVLCNCALLSEGADFPACETLILARPTKSKVRYVQMFGRVLRTSKETGKTRACIHKDSQILTNSGLVSIDKISLDHRIWDGENFVAHGGAICQGVKNVISYAGITGTPDHLVKTDEGWTTLQEANRRQLRVAKTGSGGNPIRFSDGNQPENQWLFMEPASSRQVREMPKRAHEQIPQHQETTKYRGMSPLQPTDAHQCPAMDLQKSAGTESQVREPQEARVQELRGTWNPIQIPRGERSCTLGSRKSGDTRGQNIATRQDQQQRPLRTWESPVVNRVSEYGSYEVAQHDGAYAPIPRSTPRSEICRFNTQAHAGAGIDLRSDSGTVQPPIMQAQGEVWDILDCGPLHRFTANGVLVHNCVLDHSGTVKRLGFPWDFSVTHLDDGKPKKASGGDQEKPEPLPKPCPNCHYMKPPRTPVCPSCGFESRMPNEVETAEGELVQLRGKQPKARTKLSDMGKPSVYAQLCQIAKDRQKSEKWILAQYKGIFGTWPRQEYRLEPPSPELLSWIHSRNIAWAKSQRSTA